MLVTDGENRIKDMINTPIRFLVPTNVQESMKSFTTPDIFLALGGNGYQQAKSAVDNIISESATDAGLTTALNALIKVSLVQVFNSVTKPCEYCEARVRYSFISLTILQNSYVM